MTDKNCVNLIAQWSGLLKVQVIPVYVWLDRSEVGIAIVPRYPRVMPGADACLCVKEVHLALHCCSLLCL